MNNQVFYNHKVIIMSKVFGDLPTSNDLFERLKAPGNIDNSDKIADVENIINKLPSQEINKVVKLELFEMLPCNIHLLNNISSLTFENFCDAYGDIRNFPYLPNLTVLKITNCNIYKIPDVVFDMVNLTNLCIEYTFITDIDEKIGNLTNLVVLDLSNNKITEIPESIANLHNLRKLYINCNNLDIDSIPKSLTKLSNLCDLDTSCNYFLLDDMHKEILEMDLFILQ